MFNDPADGRVGKTKSKTHMVDELVASIQKSFAEFSIPGNIFAIDESMIPWYGKYCPIRVYIKGKPYKYDIKIWQLCDWPDGFLRYFRIYPGQGDRWPFETDDQVQSWTYAERVVLCLVHDLPAGCFFTVDRHFMTPKLAAYLKKEHGQFLTGTMKKNTKNIDKELLFKKSMKIPRGFYKWSEDQDNGVAQAVWMDREVVPFCSSGFGAEPKPASRLTSHNPDEKPDEKKKVQSKKMKCPHMGVMYNGTMWTVDVSDFISLNSGTSFSRGCRSRKWWFITFLGLLDRVEANTFVTFRRRAKPKVLPHGKFPQTLNTQLFHIARKQLPIGDLPAALLIKENDFFVIWPNRPTCFRDAPIQPPTTEKNNAGNFPLVLGILA